MTCGVIGMRLQTEVLIILGCVLLTACGGGSSSGGSSDLPGTGNTTPVVSGTVTVGITDGPMEEAQNLLLYLTHIDFGHDDGDVTRIALPDGPKRLDMMRLQNGMSENLVDHASLPAGLYSWMELGIDLDQSDLELQAGGHHRMQLGDPEAMRVQEMFEISAGENGDFIIDFDLRRSIQHHDMGGMMGERYELHAGMRLTRTDQAGSLSGTIDMSLVDAYQPDCDSNAGGNWAYLYPGEAHEPDDLAETETDGIPGPIATDRVELDAKTGEYQYHFSYMPAGIYRVAFSCSSEWDEAGDIDYPNDPDGKFHFQVFGDPVEIKAGQMSEHHLGPR